MLVVDWLAWVNKGVVFGTPDESSGEYCFMLSLSVLCWLSNSTHERSDAMIFELMKVSALKGKAVSGTSVELSTKAGKPSPKTRPLLWGLWQER